MKASQLYITFLHSLATTALDSIFMHDIVNMLFSQAASLISELCTMFEILFRLLLTWSKQKFKSLIVSKTKPGVFSGSMFSIFLEVERNPCN